MKSDERYSEGNLCCRKTTEARQKTIYYVRNRPFHRVKYANLNSGLRPYNLPPTDRSRSIADRHSYLTPGVFSFSLIFMTNR